MESVSSVRLKKGLSQIKRRINDQVGAVWKLKKVDVINKLKKLNYNYSNNQLTSNSMIRKPSKIKI